MKQSQAEPPGTENRSQPGPGARDGEVGIGSNRWTAVRALVVAALITGAPFVLAIVYLVLHRAGWVERVPAIAYERTLVLSLLVFWGVAAAILAGTWHRRAVLGWLSRQKAQVALLLFSLLLSFAFAEVALRLLRPEATARPFERLPSEILHHRNAPDRSSYGMGGKKVETNEDGFRTAWDLETFLELDHRIVLLGDSFTFGLGVDVEKAVGAVLEQRLRHELAETASASAAPSVGVLNTGVISYSPLLEKQAFVHVAHRYRPTLTLLLIDANDIGDDHQYAREMVPGTEADPRFDVPPLSESTESGVAALCARSAVCRALGPVWDRLFGKPEQVLRKLLGWHREQYDYYAFEVEVAGKTERNRFFILRHPLDATRPFFDTTWGHIEDVARAVTDAGSDFALVVTPRYFHWNDAESPDNWEKDRYGVDEPYENAYLEYFDQRAVSAPFPVWSLLEPFARADGPLVFDHDPHWNEAGHRVAGEALAAYLSAAGWPASIAEAEARLSFPGAMNEEGDR